MWLRSRPAGDAHLLQELSEIDEAAESSRMLRDQSPDFFAEMRKKSMRQRLSVGVGLMIAQNMVGLNALNYCKHCIAVD